MRLAALCPVHRPDYLPVLERTVARLRLEPHDVHLVLNGVALEVPAPVWATTHRHDCSDVGEARNHCLDAVRASGHELFAFLDADDYYSPYWIDLVRSRLLRHDACALAPAWTWVGGDLIRFTRGSDSTLGGTIAGHVAKALPFQGSLGEDTQWGDFMRAAGRRVSVPSDPSGYVYCPRPSGTARFNRARLLWTRGPALSYGRLPPSAIDDPLPEGVLLQEEPNPGDLTRISW